jgi:hypothetical protein
MSVYESPFCLAVAAGKGVKGETGFPLELGNPLLSVGGMVTTR